MKKLYILVFTAVFLLYPLKTLQPKVGNYLSPHQPTQKISHLTLEEKIGQMLMVGIEGTALTPKTQKMIQDLKLGSIIIYSHNVQSPTQLQSFILETQRIAKENTQTPLFVAVDQEGGSVARIRKNAFVLPSAMAIGATGSPKLSFLAGKLTAQNLKTMGINMNLAPVLDVNTNDENSVIGVRAYSDNPDLVAQLGMWYIEGLQSQNVAATAKHFPGHGETTLDSHFAIPTLKKDLTYLEDFHLVPFRKSIANGLDAIMTAHISVPALDPSGLPATFSYNLLTNVLREKMHFEGVIITDDLEMKAIQNEFDVGQAALKAIHAGSDIVMVGWTHEKKYQVYQTLLHAVQTGKLSEERVNESVGRILALKQKRGLSKTNRLPASLESYEDLQSELMKTISKKAVTVIQNKNNLLPVSEQDSRRVLLVSPLWTFSKEIKYYNPKIKSFKIPYQTTLKQNETILNALIEKSKHVDLLLFGITHASHVSILKGLPLEVQKKTVAISFESPYVFKTLQNVGTWVCAYDLKPELLNATAQVITGVIRPRGKLPITFTPREKEPKTTVAHK
ncbi:MAG: hypothetical protein A3B70_08420 [Deltaproteobacteria bacterium RIFCSPHIGHO2_02_FULL_40_11]|nr:MAG: hypothetical protein A3B70_08420 [Deltaproteobacteria bacterium RIFCSPHIGHO2_02_FULL_40_11]